MMPEAEQAQALERDVESAAEAKTPSGTRALALDPEARWQWPREGGRLPLAGAVVLAMCAHAGVAVALWQAVIPPLGGGGEDPRAISVEIVTLATLEARAGAPAEDPAAVSENVADRAGDASFDSAAQAGQVQPVAHREAASQPPMREPQVVPTPVAESQIEPEPRDKAQAQSQDQAEVSDEPPATQAAETAATQEPADADVPAAIPPEPETTATEPEQPQIQPAERDRPASKPTESQALAPERTEAEGSTAPPPLETASIDRTPPIALEDTKPPQSGPPIPVRAPASPAASAAATAGAAASSGAAAVDRAASAARVASPGQIQAFARKVVEALQKTRPRTVRTGAGWRSEVTVVFTVASDGAPANVRVARSSGRASLDRLALRAVQRARLPRPPEGLAASKRTFAQSYLFR